jgi:hypothetical protein
MVTPEEISPVPLFVSLQAADRERLSQICPDIRLAAGEYAVHEGEERGLYVVLAGRIEAVKVVDGIERTLGERLPGAISERLPRVGPIAREIACEWVTPEAPDAAESWGGDLPPEADYPVIRAADGGTLPGQTGRSCGGRRQHGDRLVHQYLRIA